MALIRFTPGVAAALPAIAAHAAVASGLAGVPSLADEGGAPAVEDLSRLPLAAGRRADEISASLRGIGRRFAERATTTDVSPAALAMAASALWMTGAQGSTPPSSQLAAGIEPRGNAARRARPSAESLLRASEDDEGKTSNSNPPPPPAAAAIAVPGAVQVTEETPRIDDFGTLPSTTFAFPYEWRKGYYLTEAVHLIRDRATFDATVKTSTAFNAYEDPVTGEAFIFFARHRRSRWGDATSHDVIYQLLERLGAKERKLRFINRGFVEPIRIDDPEAPNQFRIEYRISELPGAMMYEANLRGDYVRLSESSRKVEKAFREAFGVRLLFAPPRPDTTGGQPFYRIG